MMEWGLQKLGFCRNSTPACPFIHAAASFLIFSPLHLPLYVLLSCSHVSASRPVLISTHLYIAGLSPHSRCLCYWKSEEWALRFECTALSGQEEKTRQGRRKRERLKRKKAPLTDGQTPVSPCPPLSPLSPSARRQQTTGIWREGGQREKREWRVKALFGLLVSDPVKVQGEEKEGWGMGTEERALNWPHCRIPSSLTVNRQKHTETAFLHSPM